MTPTVFLFDIDGTLLRSDGVGRRALTAAFERVVGTAKPLADVTFAGMTDRRIVRTGLRNAEAFEDEGLIDAVLDEYLELLPEEIAGASEYGAHEGVEELLEAAEALSGAAVGLGTGNIEPGARTKLQPLGLSERFAFGGFGSDAEERVEVLRIGARRGAERLECDVDECRIVVIGDTPEDVAAALQIRAVCLAVATGIHPRAQLEAARPTLVVDSLRDPAALAVLRG
jgi:phosphoglycolate phosphatase